MAGLYDGLEEVAFKPVAGGYVFQSNNPWLVGPRRRYFVNQPQKAIIAVCMRETLRRLKPFVFAAMILIPGILIGAIYWFATSGATLSVTIVEADGQVTKYNQSIGRGGSTGVVAGPDGSNVAFRVRGAPGNGATVTVTGISASGKPSAPAVVPFDSAGTTINVTDGKHHTLRTAKLVGRKGAASGAVMVFGMLLTLGLFGFYIAAMRAYSMLRLRPLLVGLPRSSERIAIREGFERFAAKMSNKLLAVMAFGAVMMSAGSAINLTDVIVSHRSTDGLPLLVLAAAASTLVMAQVVYLTILKVRLRRNAG